MEYVLLLLGMGAVTYLPRLFPLVFLSRRELPRWFRGWLEFIPAAVLGALVLPQLLLSGPSGKVSFLCPHFLAAVPTFIFAWKTASLAGTVIVGMGSFWLLNRLLG